MNMLRHVVAPGLFGMALAIVGFPFTTWQYWFLFLLALVWSWLPRRQEPRA